MAVSQRFEQLTLGLIIRIRNSIQHYYKLTKQIPPLGEIAIDFQKNNNGRQKPKRFPNNSH